MLGKAGHGETPVAGESPGMTERPAGSEPGMEGPARPRARQGQAGDGQRSSPLPRSALTLCRRDLPKAALA